MGGGLMNKLYFTGYGYFKVNTEKEIINYDNYRV